MHLGHKPPRPDHILRERSLPSPRNLLSHRRRCVCRCGREPDDCQDITQRRCIVGDPSDRVCELKQIIAYMSCIDDDRSHSHHRTRPFLHPKAPTEGPPNHRFCYYWRNYIKCFLSQKWSSVKQPVVFHRRRNCPPYTWNRRQKLMP